MSLISHTAVVITRRTIVLLGNNTRLLYVSVDKISRKYLILPGPMRGPNGPNEQTHVPNTRILRGPIQKGTIRRALHDQRDKKVRGEERARKFGTKK